MLLLACNTAVSATGTLDLFETTPGSHVVDLTPETYNTTLLGAENVLVEFWAPWCGKCKTIKREYERAADIAAAKGIPITIARIDAQTYKDWAMEEMEVTNLPAFFLHTGRGSEVEDFPFLTTGEAIVAGLDKMLNLGNDLPPYKLLDEWDSLELAEWLFWRGTEDGKMLTSLVLYKPTTTDVDAHGPRDERQIAAATEAFDRATKQLLRFSNLRFGMVTRQDIFEAYELPTNRASIILYTEHDEGRHEWTVPEAALAAAAEAAVTSEQGSEGSGNAAMDEAVGGLIEWVMRRDVPLVTDVYHRTLQSMRRRVPILAIAYFHEAQLDHAPTLARIIDGLQSIAFGLEKAGVVKRGQFTLAYTNGDKYSSWMSHFGLDPKQVPGMSVEWTGNKGIFGDELVVEAQPEDASGSPVVVSAFKHGEPLSFAVPPFHVEAASNVPARTSETSQTDGTAYKRASFLPPVEGHQEQDAAAAATVTASVGADGSVDTQAAGASASAEGEDVADANPTGPKVGADGLIEGPEWVDVPVATVAQALADILSGRVAPVKTDK